jgi:hypothetical protein
MTANKYKILLPRLNDKEINIPIEINWDFLDRSNDLETYEQNVVKQVLNEDKDFEVARFSHAGKGYTATELNYTFYFVPSGATSAATTWYPSYTIQGFTPNEVHFYANSFKKSFFKLDLYDSTNQKEQTNYITLILPTSQGSTTGLTVGYNTVSVKQPIFKLDFLGDKEGFFIYWLKKRDFLNINTFYMTAKFFDAKSGIFVKMMNRPQSILSGINKFSFNQENYFYYKVVLDYTDYTYRIYDINDPLNVFEVGTSTNPINWYEYINP